MVIGLLLLAAGGGARGHRVWKQFLETSRGRIAALLRRGRKTSEEIAAQLGVTTNAVRSQLMAMERDGLVRRAGQKRGATRPSLVFELTSEVEHLLSGAYIPLVTHLLRVLSKGSPPEQVKKLMRQAGRSLAAELTAPARASSTLEARVRSANEILNGELGAVTSVSRKDGGFVIRGAACPLSAITDKHPSACLVIESLLHEIVAAPVRECCDRTGRPRCCFDIGARER